MLKCNNPLALVDALSYSFPNAVKEEPTLGKVVFRIDKVICNIFLTTGTVNFQGKFDGPNKSTIESISLIIDSINSES